MESHQEGVSLQQPLWHVLEAGHRSLELLKCPTVTPETLITVSY